MTDKLKARARELTWQLFSKRLPMEEEVETAILQFAREALSEEPDEAMVSSLSGLSVEQWDGMYSDLEDKDAVAVWQRMAEARARGLE